MHHHTTTVTVALALALSASACNRQPGDSRNRGLEPGARTDRAAEQARERSDDIAKLDKQIANLERDYQDKYQKVASGEKTATAGLREEVKEDVSNARHAVNELQTTTPENWWGREEQAMRRTADDIEADVRRLAGSKLSPRPQATTGRTEVAASNAPFTSQRDALVADLRARIDAMERALGAVKARGPVDTELDDTRARLKKLGEDLDHLRAASADDWWDISETRVKDYVDRVEVSVKRLDDNSR